MNFIFCRRLYVAGAIILFVGLIYTQILRGEYYLDRAKNNYIRVVPLRSKRGIIYDRNGIELASDRGSFNIAVIPYQIKYKQEDLFKSLADFLSIDINTIRRNYRREFINYFSPVDIVKDVSKLEALRVAQDFPDTFINPVPKRFYLYAEECAHILGYVKKEETFYEDFRKYGTAPAEASGKSGAEEYYDSYLRGSDGGSLVEINAKGEIAGFLGEQKAKKGRDIYLTIDVRLQQVAYNALGNYRGSFIIMDSNNGEVICMVSRPSFNPNNFIKGVNLEAMLNDEGHPLINRAIQATYQTGSTFKPIVALAGLEEGKLTQHATFICSGSFRLGRTSFRCWNVHASQDLIGGLAHSCNVYFYNAGTILGGDIMSKWAKYLGLDLLTGIDLPYEKKGFIPSPEWKKKVLNSGWFGGDNCNFAIGQGFVSVSPLANLVAMNVFASGGYLVKPHILKKIGTVPSQILDKTPLQIEAKNLEIVKLGLKEVVEAETGTGRILKKFNLKIAGKTGTAQTGAKKPHGWFVGYFPHDSPKYTVCVFLEHGVTSYNALKVFFEFLKNAKEKKLL